MSVRMRITLSAIVVSLACIGLVAVSKSVFAADTGEFSLQVSPSPLTTTLRPGQTTTVDVKVRNTGSLTEKLKIVPRSFVIDNATGELRFDDTNEPEVASWVHFNTPNFTVQPGQEHTIKVTFAVPGDAGFSYSFGLVINRQQDTVQDTSAGRELKASVAIFTLINIDRPGATRELQLVDFTANQSLYEYLPVELDVKFKNTGNAIIQPAGNIFIQRGSNDDTPMSTLPVNKGDGHILPGSVRTLHAEWDDGFQVLRSSTALDGSLSKQLEWDWSNLSHLRIGRYTAKLVAVYNDGQRDVPVLGEVSFWVVPWKLLLGILLVLLLVTVGLWSMTKNALRLSKRKKRMHFKRLS